MQDKRYIFVIMDSSGAQTRRVSLKRSTLRRLALGAVAFFLVGTSLVVHAVNHVAVARESLALAHDNGRLQQAIVRTELEAQNVDIEAMRAQMSAGEVLIRAGLGSGSPLLAAGPLDSPPPSHIQAQEEATDSVISSAKVVQNARRLEENLEGLIEYFRDADRLLQNTPALRPAPSTWYTSGFGKRRHPITKKTVMHKGIDLGGYTGMEIFAPADGVVIWLGNRGGYGKTIVLDHGYGVQTHFAHLSAYEIKLGDRVRRGDIIAKMGSTGMSTGPHLHYEVRRHGVPLNPANFILD